MKAIRPTIITDVMLTSVKSNGIEIQENEYSTYDSTAAYTTIGAYVLSTTTHRVYKVLRSNRPTATISIASPGVVTYNNHNLSLNHPIKFATTGALPTGLTAGTQYYAIPITADTLQVAASAGGAPINTSGSQSGVHTMQFAIDPTTENNATLPYWLNTGPTNKWAAFDKQVGTQTTATTSLEFVLAPGRIDSLALLNIDAGTLFVSMVSGVETVYSKTLDLAEDVVDWDEYFFEPIERKSDVVLLDVPTYGDGIVTVTLTGATGEIVKCGGLIVGMQSDIGETQYQPTIGIISYSVKNIDEFGNATLVKRVNAKRMNAKMWIPNYKVDKVFKTLSSMDSEEIVYLGADDMFTSLIVYGFFKDFEIELSNASSSFCTIQVEGLI